MFLISTHNMHFLEELVSKPDNVDMFSVNEMFVKIC